MLERLELTSNLETQTEKNNSTLVVVIRHGDVRTYGDPYSSLSLKGVRRIKGLASSWANVFATVSDIKFDVEIRFSPRLRTTQSAYLFDYFLFQTLRQMGANNVSTSTDPLVDERLSPDGTVSVMGTYKNWALSKEADILEKNGKTPEAVKAELIEIFNEINHGSQKLPDSIRKVAFLWTHETSFRALWPEIIDFAYAECKEFMWPGTNTY